MSEIAQPLLFTPRTLGDICSRRHRGNDNSRAAFTRTEAHLPEMRGRVLAFIRAQERQGATVKEAAEHLGVEVNHVSGRMSELKVDCSIVPSPRERRREHCGVYVAAEFA